jgi:hypothetical protein
MQSLMSQNAVIRETSYSCKGCNKTVSRYIDYTPGAILAKYVCDCGYRGPQFPLYKEEVK